MIKIFCTIKHIFSQIPITVMQTLSDLYHFYYNQNKLNLVQYYVYNYECTPQFNNCNYLKYILCILAVIIMIF